MLDINKLRHSTAHVMAYAIKKLYKDAKFAIGPSIEDGFYYDIDLDEKITIDDFPKIEAEMQKIIAADIPFVCQKLSREEALGKFKDDPYKIELLADIAQDEAITIYQNDDFFDLCRGPHLDSTGQIKAFKLLKVSGAYFKGDEKRNMLQRIYGTAFALQKDLDKYLFMLAEAEKRDHRKLGKDLELFNIFEVAGAGLVYYYPKGATLKKIIEDFVWQENIKRGYQHVNIPHIAKADLWQRSGHLDYYKENMFFAETQEQEYVVKPMNCPGHILIYESKLRSYKDLPLRIAEFGTVYRNERSGVLHGLLRVRGFTQDDAHIFCTAENLNQEIINVLNYADFIMKTFGFEYQAYLSTRPEKSVGSDENWQKATDALIFALENNTIDYLVDPGEGVFYGPKIDIKFKDAIGRTWQGPTVQVDFNLPERFDLAYVGQDGKRHRPIMIHRVVLGSLERFLGALIEHYAGSFPLWLAPVQIKLMTISEAQIDYAKQIETELLANNFRIETDYDNEKIGQKIRNTQMARIPTMLIIGKKEQDNKTVSVRDLKQGDLGSFAINDIIKQLKEKIINKGG